MEQFFNQRRPLLSSRETGWEGLTLEQYFLQPGEEDLSPRSEHFICINLSEHGTLRQERDGQLHMNDHSAGDVVFMPAGQPSRWQWSRPVSVLHLQVQTALVNQFSAETGSSALELVNSYGASDLRLLHLALALKAEVETGERNGPLFAQCLSTALAAHLVKQYGGEALQAPAQTHRLSPRQIKIVNDYVRGNLDLSLSLAEIAGIVHASPFHFARQFKRATGTTLHRFVIQARIEAAILLLKQDTLSVGQIAGIVGFAHQSHLASHFKRVTGLSPTEFRNQCLI